MNRKEDINDVAARVARHLQTLYGARFSEGLINRILAMLPSGLPARPAWDEKDVILITYGSSIRAPGERPLETLLQFLRTRVQHRISCVHILPFFPATSDDGFSVRDYLTVDPSLGTWEDIAALGSQYTLMFDLVINHVSASHPWFTEFLSQPVPGNDFFPVQDPDGDYSRVVRPRTSPLFTAFPAVDGIRKVWTTFSSDQVDLNFSNPAVLLELISVMLFYIGKGVRILRLDAIAFLWKEKNTRCLHLPGTHEVVKLLRDIACYVAPGTLILTETNVPQPENLSYFGKGDEAHMVYQFTLPPLLLYTLLKGNAEALSSWAERLPVLPAGQTFLNFTASHDGIGIRPLEGILPPEEAVQLAAVIRQSGGAISERNQPDGTTGIYELNVTWFSAMQHTFTGTDAFQEARFMCSQLIMLALQGIPALYIQSLLAAPNDYEGMRQTGRARSINRKSWEEKEIRELEAADPAQGRIFRELLRTLDLRRNTKVFHPDAGQQVLRLGDAFFAVKRGTGNEAVTCISNITAGEVMLEMQHAGSSIPRKDMLTGQTITGSNVIFMAYQTRWLIMTPETP